MHDISAKSKVLITGSTGFVGRFMCSELENRGMPFCAVVRSTKYLPCCSEYELIPEIGPETNWDKALHGVDKVIHLAGRAHVLNESEENPRKSYKTINVSSTLNLARQAANAGIKRFVFVSSIKVNGESTSTDNPFRSDDEPYPMDEYAISKHEAELGLRQIAIETEMDVVIVRPPLVYGQGVKGNLALLQNLISKGIPLPLGAVTTNKRSFIYLGNLADFIILCLDHHLAKNHTFLVSDGNDLSTKSLIMHIANGLGCTVRLIPVDIFILHIGAKVLGKVDVYKRLCGSLAVDIESTRRLLDWTPPFSVEEGFRNII